MIVASVVGAAAGTIICVSAAPRVWSLVHDQGLAAKESLSRNAMLTAGNILWIVYGTLTGSILLCVMCGVSTVLNGLVLGLAVHAKAQRGPARPRR